MCVCAGMTMLHDQKIISTMSTSTTCIWFTRSCNFLLVFPYMRWNFIYKIMNFRNTQNIVLQKAERVIPDYKLYIYIINYLCSFFLNFSIIILAFQNPNKKLMHIHDIFQLLFHVSIKYHNHYFIITTCSNDTCLGASCESIIRVNLGLYSNKLLRGNNYVPWTP